MRLYTPHFISLEMRSHAIWAATEVDTVDGCIGGVTIDSLVIAEGSG